MTMNSTTVEVDVYEQGTATPYQQGSSYKLWVGKLHEIMDYSGLDTGPNDNIYIGFNAPSDDAVFLTGEICIGSEKPAVGDNKKWRKVTEKGESGKITLPIEWLNQLCPPQIKIGEDETPLKIWSGDGVIVLEPTQFPTYTDRLDTGKDRRVTITKPMTDIVDEDSEEEYYIEFAGDFDIEGCIAGNVVTAENAETEYRFSRKIGYTNEKKYYVTIPTKLYERIDWEVPDGIRPYITISTEGRALIFCKPDVQTIRYRAHQPE